MDSFGPDVQSKWRNWRYLRWALALALALTGAGIAACLAWIFHRPDLLQILPTSSVVRFNTSIAFSLSGLALVAVIREARLAASAVSAIVVLIGVLSVLENLTGASWGADRLTIHGEWDALTAHFGRMAPNTAVTFVLAGGGLLILCSSWRAWTPAVVSMLAALVVAIALIALLGYAVDLVPAYEWGRSTRMAFLTAALFAILGCGLILAAYGLSDSQRWQDMPWLASSAGIGFAALTALGWNALRNAQFPGMPLAWAALPDVVLGLGICLSALLVGLIAQARHLKLQAETLERANRDLQQRSEEIHDLYDRAPCGYHSLNADGVIVEINETELKWLGYTREEVVGKLRAVDLLTEPSRRAFAEVFPRFKKSGLLQDMDLEFVRKDSTLLPVIANATAEFDPSGAFVKSRTTLFDVTERNNAQRALQLLAAVVKCSHDAIVSKSLDGTVTSWNQAAERLFGYNAAEIIGQPIALIVPPDRLDEEAQILERIRNGQTLVIHETIRRRKDGSMVDVALAISPIFDSNGGVIGAAKIAHDLSEQKRSQAALKDSEQQVEKILERLQTAVVVHGHDTRIRFVNPSAANILGLSRDQLMGRAVMDPYWHFVREDMQPMPPGEYPVSLVMKSKSTLNDYVVGINISPDLSTRWVLVNAVPDLGPFGEVRQIVVSFVDISERKRLAQELELQARTDALTQLATRRHFMEVAEREYARSRRHRHDLTLLLLDVDHFKAINDEYGHHGGDLALQALAQVIRSTLRSVDVAGRLGGEEFCVLLPETGMDMAIEVAERLRKEVAATEVSLPGRGTLHFTISVGISSIDASDPDFASIVERADQAMYHAKRSGRNQVQAGHRVAMPH